MKVKNYSANLNGSPFIHETIKIFRQDLTQKCILKKLSQQQRFLQWQSYGEFSCSVDQQQQQGLQPTNPYNSDAKQVEAYCNHKRMIHWDLPCSEEDWK